jgi:hypothetical protein
MNHREAIAAMDFFTVPTVTLRVLYCFFVISQACQACQNFRKNREGHTIAPRYEVS